MTNPKLLFAVENSFSIEDRGMVLTPGILLNDPVKRGDSIRLQFADGSQMWAIIQSVEWPTYPADFPREPRRAGICVRLESQQTSIPEGTKVWSESPRPLNKS